MNLDWHQRDQSKYRELIDRLVDQCRNGQGTVGSGRVMAGIWNANATPSRFADQYEFNQLLKRLPSEDRPVLAKMLKHAFESGVHSTLVELHEVKLPPFEDGYEGTPFHDFVGRLADDPWPKD
jgi:hypothetical protein